jgi:tetratricopeptide (TPR) repeat protein
MKSNKKKPEAYHFFKGNLEQISEKFEKALKAYNIALTHNPDYLRAINNRAIVKQTLNDFTGALEDYNRVIELGHHNYHILKNRGTVRLQLNDYEGALDDFGNALEFEKHAEIFYFRGNIYFKLEENEKALSEYHQYIIEGYGDPEIYTITGIIYGKMGNIENSINCFSQAIESDSTYTYALYNRAYAKYISFDYAGALIDCEKLLSIDSYYSNAQVLKSEIQKKLKPL